MWATEVSTEDLFNQLGITEENPLRLWMENHAWGVMLLIVLATFVSEDLTCISAGILAANGTLPYPQAVIACFIGIFVSDMWLFLTGRFLGKPALNYPPFKWLLTPERVESSQQLLKKRGAVIIVATRFVPGSRLPTYFAAGMLGQGLSRLLAYFILAAAIWTPLLVGIAMQAGEWMLKNLSTYQHFALPVLVGFFAIFYLTINHLLPLLTWRGRRLAISRWKRWTHWEYWPRSAMYTPVILYIVTYLMWRYGLRSCTAANPCMDGAGGLSGESKTQILDHLQNCGAPVAPYQTLPQALSIDNKLLQIRALLEAAPSPQCPCVLKPEQGERGSGVQIIRSEAEARTWLEAHNENAIAQAYLGGVEYGIFYARHPANPRGSIISITDKQYTYVTGDGIQTVEACILNDPRALCMAPFFLKQYAHQLNDIPARAERFALASIGTHCRGALFLDGKDILTPELEATFDRICQRIDGFFFGRFDAKAPSKEAWMQGKDIQILELNGLTSESTHIYNPGYSLLAAYRTLMKQWKLAYQIGYANRQQGAKVASYREILQAML